MFGMGFTEILFIAVIAILFLGPDKLPTAMVEIAKFFRSAKKTIGSVKDSIEEEMNVKEIKEEALAYKKELLGAGEEIGQIANTTNIVPSFSDLGEDLLAENDDDDDTLLKKAKKEKKATKAEKVTFEKKPKKDKKEKKSKKEDIDV